MSNFVFYSSNDNILTSFLCDKKLQVTSSLLHADGVVAREIIPVGDTIYAEKPLCFLQSLPNVQDLIVCGGCQAVLGGLDVQVGILSKTLSREDINNKSDFCECQAKCGVLYCSGMMMCWLSISVQYI